MTKLPDRVVLGSQSLEMEKRYNSIGVALLGKSSIVTIRREARLQYYHCGLNQDSEKRLATPEKDCIISKQGSSFAWLKDVHLAILFASDLSAAIWTSRVAMLPNPQSYAVRMPSHMVTGQFCDLVEQLEIVETNHACQTVTSQH